MNIIQQTKQVNLQEHQLQAIIQTRNRGRVAYYLDMGLGKTFVGSEKMKMLGTDCNIVVCQKSKIADWIEHFETFYDFPVIAFDKHQASDLPSRYVLIINYDKVPLREELMKLANYTLVLDESSYVKNEKAKRTKAIMKLKAANVILLSGTPTGGKYEELYSQCKLLGWHISKGDFYDRYIITKKINVNGYHIDVVKGYQNVDELKQKLREYGAVFMKSEEVITLPKQVEINVNVPLPAEYKRFKRDRLVVIEGKELVGDTALTHLLYLRAIAAPYNKHKYTALGELLESTTDRLIIFYNWQSECDRITDLCKKLKKPVSVVNGKKRDLKAYEDNDDSVTLVQYQAGAMGLNLQKSNKIIYFSLPLSSEQFEQSKKRTHRIGQHRTCFYWYLMTDSVEKDIYETLSMRRDYTAELFREEEIGA